MSKNISKVVIIILSLIVIASSVVTPYYWMESKKLEEELVATSESLMVAQNKLDATEVTLEVVSNDLNVEIEKNEGLSASLGNMSKELEEANITIEELKNDEYEFVYIGDFKLTHYCKGAYPHICGSGAGVTATGTKITVGRTVAVDPKQIPYGTQMYIEGYGWRTAEDCGGAVKGNHIDIAVETHDQAMSMGIKYGGVWVLKKKNS